MAWNRTVLRRAGARIDYLAIHHYYSQRDMDGDLRNLMARPLSLRALVRRGRRRAPRAGAGPRRPQLAINEWGLDLPEPRQHSMESAPVRRRG